MMPRIARRLPFILADVAVGVVLVALVALAAPVTWGWHQATVLGGSMGAALPVGSVAVLRTVDARDLNVGDIIAVKATGARTVMHRIADIEESGAERVAILKGDANEHADAVPVVLRGEGDRVAYHVPLAGYLFAWARSPFVLVIAAAMLLLPEVAVPLRSAVRRRRSSRVRQATGADVAELAPSAALALRARMRPKRQAARRDRA